MLMVVSHFRNTNHMSEFLWFSFSTSLICARVHGSFDKDERWRLCDLSCAQALALF